MTIHQHYYLFQPTELNWMGLVILALGIIIIAVILLSPPASADTTATASVHTNSVKHRTLPNGLELYVFEDSTTPAVSVNLWYKAGSRDEPLEMQGLAHLLEHMMFNGSKNIPKNGHANLIDAAGGMVNAFTTNDVTVYWNKVPNNMLATVLYLEAERMINLEITSEKVNTEKEIVKEEYRISFQNDALGAALDQLLAVSLEGTPYAWTPAGTLQTIDDITASDLQQFYKTYYTPNNAVLVIAGDTSIETAYQIALDAFGSIAPGPILSREPVALPRQEGPRYMDISMPLQLPTIVGGYIIPGTQGPDYIPLQIASLILSAGQSSRLHRKLVREEGTAVAAAGYAQPFRDVGLFLNLAFHLEHHHPDEVISAMQSEIEGMADHPPSLEELEKARNQVAASYGFSLDSLDGVANAIGSAVVLGRGLEEFENALEEYSFVTAQDVQDAVRKYLRPGNLTVFRVRPGSPPQELIPTEGTLQTQTAQPKHAEQPADAIPVELDALEMLRKRLDIAEPAADKVALPPMTQFQLANGLNVWLIQREAKPLAAIQLVLPKAGTYMEPMGKAGIANFAAGMLRQGTQSKTADEISQTIDSAGGSLSVWADDDGTTILAQVMSKDLALAMELVSDITIQPTFPREEIETLRQQYLGGLYRQRDDASSFANDQALAFHYGPEHPLGRPATIASVESIQREDLSNFVEQYYDPRDAILVATGDIDLEVFQKLVEEHFGPWSVNPAKDADARHTVSPTKEVKMGLPEPSHHPRLLFIEKPGQTQVQIRMTQKGPSRGAHERIAVDLYNYILGGGSFSSRLMQVIRSEMGETYGIGSGYRSREHDGMFILSTFTGNDKLYRTMTVIKSELEKFASEGITQKELEYAKANRIGSYPLRFETLSDTAQTIIRGLRFSSLAEVENYPLLVQGQNQADVKAAVKKYFDPDNFAIVLLGDPSVSQQVDAVANLFGMEPSAVEKIDWLEVD
ncbi:MAG: insulinase family protein [Firmicutes bacterium]|nr:insulinase family protein [Bacillota bacterium]